MKLHLGCGHSHLEGFINVDRESILNPDQVVDLEALPWPWESNSVDEIVMEHVLEHLGQNTQIYLGIIQELYRVCKPQALIRIRVPHPRSDNYLADPTHVRPILPDGLDLFNQSSNRKAEKENKSNTSLGLILNVDFRILEVEYDLQEPWQTQLAEEKINQSEMVHLVRSSFNIVNDIIILWQVFK